jgi:hypothetical protein
LIKNKYEDYLSSIFRKERWKKAIAFFEFYGPNSFAGIHDPNDEHDVTLFDVSADNRGFLEPRAFIRTFADKVETAPLLYRGNPNSDFVKSVQEGELDGMTYEGVVCKGKVVTPGLPLMFKVKNKAWIEAVKARWAGDEKAIQERL